MATLNNVPLLEASVIEPQQSARFAGLRYVSDRAAGYTRRRRGRGFTYLDSRGQIVTDPILKTRFQALVIPPAWQNVWICRYDNGHIQVTGRDERGRKQYIYHPDWEVIRNQTKFERLPAFAAALPALRQRVDQDLTRRGFPREKVLAILVRLLDSTLIRIGNPEYARANQSYGLTTLEDDHITVQGSRLVFSFQGKSGKLQEVEVFDRQLARRMKRLQELPGQRLFQYQDDRGCLQEVRSEDVNDYLRQSCGEQFTAKDFRTWGGTAQAVFELYRVGPAETDAQQRRTIAAIIRRVASVLGNTPAVCRDYYIHPAVFQAYSDGTLFTAVQLAAQEPRDAYSLLPEERAAQRILAGPADVKKTIK